MPAVHLDSELDVWSCDVDNGGGVAGQEKFVLAQPSEIFVGEGFGEDHLGMTHRYRQLVRTSEDYTPEPLRPGATHLDGAGSKGSYLGE